MRIALIGQAPFAADVFERLKAAGHHIVAFTPPDQKGRPDALAAAATARGVTVHKVEKWKERKPRKVDAGGRFSKPGGKALPEVMSIFEKEGPFDLGVLAFVPFHVPMEVISFPEKGSIVYHPSILPRHRGASAINWTVMSGDDEGGFTVFWADDGLDTGPILLQRSSPLGCNDTMGGFYKDWLFPEGVKGVVDAVDMVAKGTAPRIEQTREGESYEPIWQTPAQVDWTKSAQEVHNFVRGCDRAPGAFTIVGGERLMLYGSRLVDPTATYSDAECRGVVAVECSTYAAKEARVVNTGMVFKCGDGGQVLITQVSHKGRSMAGSDFLEPPDDSPLELDEAGMKVDEMVKGIWSKILGVPSSRVKMDTDFFEGGAGSMDVVRMVNTVNESLGIDTPVEPEQVFTATRYKAFLQLVLKNVGGGVAAKPIPKVRVMANKVEVSWPTQLFIGGEFVDAVSGKTFPTVNPTTEEVLCQVSEAATVDVNRAVAAAKKAFEDGEWTKMNARDRGKLMFRLADLMEKHKEELSTIEALDSGAVYTLALKTHVGMSIDVFRYMAGWCDKVHGKTIPINHARPKRDLCLTKREPFGVVGLVVPWNYPLMMLAWKMSAALAAGNTVVIKPAKVTPLTALKFAELVSIAGFPPGVINVVPGKGTEVGEAITRHPDVRKVGFTGSTEVGQTIMAAAAESNAKKVSLELGGKSPLIIFADSNLDDAVRFALSAVFFNKGENCIAAGRIFVENRIHDTFIERVVQGARSMIIGDPLDRDTNHGPQNHDVHFNSLLKYIDQAVKDGAIVHYGGKRHGTKGFFLEPTVISGVRDGTFAATEESFGPIMLVSSFDGDVDDVLRRANATSFGLASGVFTQDVEKALLVSEGLQAGTVFVNTYNKTDVAAPFGGFKMSGFGKDMGEEALDEYLKTKAIIIEFRSKL